MNNPGEQEVEAYVNFTRALAAFRESIRGDKITKNSKAINTEKDISTIQKCLSTLKETFTQYKSQNTNAMEKSDPIFLQISTLVESLTENKKIHHILDYVVLRTEFSEKIATQLNELEKILDPMAEKHGGRRRSTRRRSTRRRSTRRRSTRRRSQRQRQR